MAYGKYTRRDFLRLGGAGLAGAAMLGVTGCGGGSGGGSGGGPPSLRIGYIEDVHGGGLVAVADEQGYWEEAGVDPDLQSFTDGPTQIQAIGAGELDFGYIGPGALWLPASGQATVVTIDSLSFGDTIIARPDDVGSLEELGGKRVGAPEGTSGEMILNLALERAGLTREDIEFVPITPEAAVTAFVSGDIDATCPFPPGAFEVLNQVPDAKILVSTQDFQPEYTFPEVWVANNDLIEEDPGAVKAFLRAFALANDWRAAHVSETVTLTAELSNTPEDGNRFLAEKTKWLTSKEIVEANESGDTFDWMNGLQGLFVDMGQLDGERPPEEFVDVDLLSQAVEEVG